MATLSDLLQQPTRDQIFNALIAVYQKNGFPTQSWEPFGADRTRLSAIATVVHDLVSVAIPAIAGGGLVDYSSGDWLRLLAQQVYNVAYNAAGFAAGNITLTSSASAPAYTIAAGDLIAVFPSGRRFVNTTGGVLATNGTLTLSFQAESAGSAYNELSNQALTLVSPLPGVTLSNTAGPFSSVAHVGSGTGTMTVSGSPTAPHYVTVRVDASATTAPATLSYSLDGAPYVSVGSVSGFSIPGVSITVALNNGLAGTSFIAGDTYSFATPGSWLTTQGSDIESDPALQARCKARWSTLSPVPVSNFYYLLATSTPTVGGQVTGVIVQPDSVVSAQVNMIVTGPAGVLAPATIAAIQTYVTPRAPGTEKIVVSSPTTQTVTLAGTITCSAQLLQSVQAAVLTAMTNYIASVPVNGTVRLAAITELVMQTTGVVDISGVTINGSAANLTLGSSTTFVLPSLVTPLSFNYATV